MSNLAPLLVSLAAILVAAKLLGEVAQRFGQPAVVGELIAGVILGPSVLGLVAPHDPVIEALATLGVIVLLFEIGLQTDVDRLRRSGRDATIVATVGVVVPFILGFGATRALGLRPGASLIVAAALTATSVGISARVLRDLDRLETPEGQVVLGAAVLDDILGLVILGIVSTIVAGGRVTLFGVVIAIALAFGFVVAALAVGSAAAPPVFRVVERLRTSGALGLMALAFAFLSSALAEWSGSAMIIGALAAGLTLHRVPQRTAIERGVTQLGYFFVPIFFASMGALVDLRRLADGRALLLGALLIVVGIAGKLASGYALRGFEGNKLLIGVAMIPRGEVGLIFAQVGLATGVIGDGEFGAIILMVVVTTLAMPPWLASVARTRARRTVDPAGDGLGDLVSGARPMTPRATQPIKRDYKVE